MLNHLYREGRNLSNICVVSLIAFAVLAFIALAIGAGKFGVFLAALMAGAVGVYQFVDRPNIPSQEEILVANEKTHKKRTLWSVIGPYFQQERSNHRARMRVMYELDNMGMISLYLRYKREGRLSEILEEEEIEYSNSAFPVAVVAAAAVATGAVGSARTDIQQSVCEAQQNVASNVTEPVELTPGGFPAVRNTTPTEEDFLGMNDEPEIIPDVVDCAEEPECFDDSTTAGSVCDNDDDYLFDDDSSNDLYCA